jgi:large subunit ribosomal protein L25
MAKIRQIPVEFRKDEGKGASRRLRRAGKVPAIIYGGELAPRALQLEQLKAGIYIQNEWFFTSILELEAGGETQKALVRDVQRHPYKPIVMHIDFQRISENEVVRLRVPLHFLNQEKSPAGKTGGALILHELNDVEVSCLPKDLPEFIEVDLVDLKVGDTLHLSDLKLPAGVDVPELKLGKEHDVAIVVARMPAAETEETAEGAPVAAEVPAAKQKAPEAAAKGGAPAKGGAAPAKAAPKKK